MHRYCRLVGLLAAFAVGGCVTNGRGISSAPPSRIEAIQPGDQRLACAELRDQMAQMDRYIADGQRANTDIQERGAAGSATNATVGSAVPYAGMLVSLLSTNPGIYEAQNRMNRAEEAAERKKQLTILYNQKDCR